MNSNNRPNVVPLKFSFDEKSHAENDRQLFKDLAGRIEIRLDKLERELMESIQMLESDIQKAVKSKKHGDETLVKQDLHQLNHILESRLQKTLKLLSREAASGSREQSETIEGIRKASSHLIKLLSFDFYKTVLDRLGNAEYTEEVDPFGMDKRLLEKIKPILDFLYYKYWRVTTTGIENIPNEARALIEANHSGPEPYDGAMIKAAIMNEHPKRKDARFLVENFVYHMPFMGNLMYRIGGGRACPENAELLLNSEHLVVVFPEGVKGIGKFFNQRYKLQRFGRGGFIKLCMKTKSPLIPVGVTGAEEIHPIIFKSNILAKTIGLPYIPITPTFPFLGLLGCIPFPTKWAMHFGKPISFERHGIKAIDDELLIHKLSEQVRSEIQNIIIDLLKKRRSVFMG